MKKWYVLCEFPHQMGALLLNLMLCEPLSWVDEFPCFENSIELEILTENALNLCFHDPINGGLL